MRVSIKSVILIFVLTSAGITLHAGDNAIVPERSAGPVEWIGKGLGRIVDGTLYQAWSWATDPAYDGLTKLRRFGALGCFICAAGCFGSSAWRNWNSRRRENTTLWKGTGFAALGFLLTLRPEPVYRAC